MSILLTQENMYHVKLAKILSYIMLNHLGINLIHLH